MKTVGLIGGMSWESTATYYRLINEGIRARCGGLHSAKLLLYSVDFAEVEAMQSQGRWQDAGALLADAARRLERGGADFLLICTNTMHKVADQVTEACRVPLLHIADATARRVVADGIRSVGLLGTRFTMEQDFYRAKLEKDYGLTVLVPDTDDRQLVHDIIYRDLCCGVINPTCRQQYQRIVGDLAGRGADAVILGCTEISLLIGPRDVDLPLYDTTELHADMAVRALVADA